MTAATAEAAATTPIPRPPDIEKERKAMVVEAASEDDPRPATEDPKAQELFTFEIRVVDASGKVWEGSFTNRILTIPERGEVGVLAARLAGGIDNAALDGETAYLLRAQAHLTLSLDKEKGGVRPRWFKLAGDDAILNTRILNKVYAEVNAHESYFRGPVTDQG